MFRVVFFVDDKKLGAALIGLTGIARGAPQVQPVVNEQIASNGQLVARTSGHILDLLHEYFKKKKLPDVKLADIRQFLESHGRSPRSAASLCARGLAAGFLLKNKGRGGYRLKDASK